MTYPVGRTLRLAWALAGLWLAGVTAVVGALFSGSALMHRPYGAVFLAASIVVAGLACLTFWRSQRARMLLWDGERWSLEPGNDDGYSEMARLQVRMDLQQAMLLSFEDPYAGRRRIWLWAEAAHHPMRWHLLRCALYSSTVPAAPELLVGERV